MVVGTIYTVLMFIMFAMMVVVVFSMMPVVMLPRVKDFADNVNSTIQTGNVSQYRWATIHKDLGVDDRRFLVTGDGGEREFALNNVRVNGVVLEQSIGSQIEGEYRCGMR